MRHFRTRCRPNAGLDPEFRTDLFSKTSQFRLPINNDQSFSLSYNLFKVSKPQYSHHIKIRFATHISVIVSNDLNSDPEFPGLPFPISIPTFKRRLQPISTDGRTGETMQARRPACSLQHNSDQPQTSEQQTRRSFLKTSMSSLVLGSLFTGCHQLELTKWFDKDEEMRDNVRSAIKGEDGHSKLIGDYIKIAESTLGYIKVQGVGYVHGLEGTGEDPPASPLRTRLMDDMRREGVTDPNTLLRSADTCLVVVTAYIPPIVRKGDIMDVEVKLPDGSEARSLAGGWLMPCRLSEHALLEGQVREGTEIAVATGPILVNSLAESDSQSRHGLREGVIPGGGKYTGDERKLTVAIRSDYRTVRMSTTIANRIGKRFYDYDSSGLQRPLCVAKSNAHLELVVHERYRDNYPRYLQCIRHMSLTETPVEKHMRIQQLENNIQFGPTSEKAALQLEAVGADAIPILKTGLTSKSPEAQFRAAEALAYLGRNDGVEALKNSAANEPAFRIFALAALGALPDPSAGEALRELMNSDSLETCYGAFRALTTMAPNDPFIQPASMKGNYNLHLIHSTGKPFIHLTRRKKAEVVLFKADQEFQLPMFLRAGGKILVQGTPSADGVVVKRIAAKESTQSRTVAKTVAEVIKAASDLGATYPDIVEMLVQAEKQHNLPGEIAIDKLPKPGRIYHRKPEDFDGTQGSGTPTPVPIGNDGIMPNLFDEQPNKPVLPTSTPPPTTAGGANATPNSFEVL